MLPKRLLRQLLPLIHAASSADPRITSSNNMHPSSLTTHGQVFDINDFTSASDWEQFISDLEQALCQWNLSSGQQKAGTKRLNREQLSVVSWALQSVPVQFSKFPLVLHHFSARDLPNEEPLDQQSVRHGHELPVAMQDTASCEHDFVSNCPTVTRLFGLREFVMIASADKTNHISNIDRAKLLISSAAISQGNIKCSVPVFVQVAPDHFIGILIDADKRTNFDMVCLREFPSKFKHLSALLALFKEKLGYSATECISVRVSVRFINLIRRWPEALLHYHHPICFENPPAEICNTIDFVSYEEPIRELRLSFLWESLSEEMINDSPFHSDLDPLTAPVWFLELRPEKNLNSSLWSYVHTLQNLKEKNEKDASPLLNRIQEKAEEAESEVRNVLDKLSGQKPLTLTLPTFQSYLPQISESVVKFLVNLIFSPDNVHDVPDSDHVLNEFKWIKSCKFDNLTWRMGHVIAFISVSVKDVDSIVLLWREIIQELRKCWESGSLLSGMEAETVDASSCLLNQKLQMLNCCVAQKRKWDMHGDADDEFHDAVEHLTIGPGAEGRSHRLDGMFLLNSQQEMFAPVCQDAKPMTDDMVQEETEILSHLGTSSEATAVRTRMQLPSLLSDMEAFKAANPGAALEDFVRWYSPRDYDEQSGLSTRMQSQGNTWIEAWNSARCVPVARQRKLFDYVKEGEKVLHYLSSLSLSSLAHLCIPIILHSAISQLSREYHLLGLQSLKPFDAKSFTSSNLNAVRHLEQAILIFKSLNRKWASSHQSGSPPQSEDILQFNWDLCSKGQVTVSTSTQRQMIMDLIRAKKERERDELDAGERLMTEDQSLLLPVSTKEFVLRVDLPRPALYSRSLPQRMNFLLSDNDFRIASSLSHDTSFS